MSCPTCDHTMQKLNSTGFGQFFCPRCGTLVEQGSGGFVRITRPKVVDYLRSFYRCVASGEDGRFLRELAHAEGITESILTPGDRPK